ncbi:methyl-accepting chemotaxis protein [Paenibacillus sp. 1011MAR3C5]|uniref:methyl-accepting chemotaxis protein n=1 Tax=Paenibacillus sp. 1011MAR3C5 TaxID=1675787 RepID=UPI000E6C7D6C|nr:methyl-accepting chemotaxis protein [Paenibacillus sp. 1011MAR3C5]RJE89738.1 methyl-accepting chemotaxis protein [Paenibacillus sp. 1011MAR3C5]
MKIAEWKWMKSIRDSVRIKFITLLLSLTVVPVVLIAGLLTSLFTDIVEKDVKAQQVIIASSNATVLGDFLQSKVSIVESMVETYNKQFINGDEETILTLLQSMKAMSPDVKSYTYAPESGQSISDNKEILDLSKFSNFIRIKEEKTVAISDILPDGVSGENIIIIDVPILDDQQQFQGLVQAIVNPSRILDNLNRNKMSESSYVYLLGQDGSYLAHPDNEKVGQNFREHANEDKIKAYTEQVLIRENGNVFYSEPDGLNKLAAYAAVELTGWRVIVSGDEEELMSSVTKARGTGILVIVLCSLAVAIISYFVAGFILRPIFAMSGLMTKVSSGDLTDRLPVKGNDELDRLRLNMNEMLDSFKMTLMKLSEAVEHTAVSSEQLTAISVDSAAAAEQTAVAVDRVATGAKSQHHGSEQSAIAMEEMAVGIQKIAESSGVVSEHAQMMHADVMEGDRIVQLAVGQITQANGAVGRSAEMVRELEAKTAEINGIVGYISEIASQTNLLALNASIEAARAGEHGRGFAVVAEEVKKLAVQTTEATVSIGSILHEIQRSTASTSTAIAEGIGEVHKSVDQFEQVGQAFESIMTTVNGVSAQIQEVSAATEELSASTEEVSASMQEIVGISEHALQELDQISEGTRRQRDSMKEISSSSESLSRMATELQELVALFKLK